MSSVPARDRGAASGMRATVQNSGMSWSIGFFFSLMIAGLAATPVAQHVAHLPPVSTLFASFLGHNQIRNLLRPAGVLARLPARNAADLTGKESSRTSSRDRSTTA